MSEIEFFILYLRSPQSPMKDSPSQLTCTFCGERQRSPSLRCILCLGLDSLGGSVHSPYCANKTPGNIAATVTVVLMNQQSSLNHLFFLFFTFLLVLI